MSSKSLIYAVAVCMVFCHAGSACRCMAAASDIKFCSTAASYLLRSFQNALRVSHSGPKPSSCEVAFWRMSALTRSGWAIASRTDGTAVVLHVQHVRHPPNTLRKVIDDGREVIERIGELVGRRRVAMTKPWIC